jgi:hypothetical protein
VERRGFMEFSFEELFGHEYWNTHGYITGLGRDYPHPNKSHLYRGTLDAPKEPLCKKGWNRDNGTGFSIWRNVVGTRGNCLICIKKARKEIARANSKED